MSANTPFELLAVATTLFPKQLAGESDSEKVAALRKTAALFELAKDVLDNPDAAVLEAAQASDERYSRIVKFDAHELVKMSGTKVDPRETASEIAKRIHRKATRRAARLNLPCPSLENGITLAEAEKLFSASIKPGPKPRNNT